MALTSFWLSSTQELSTKHVQAMVGLAGNEGKLRDGNNAAQEFRAFLNVVPLEHLARYAGECLGEDKFADGGRALQDIINEVGRRLGFDAENGLYQGKSGSVGFDGLWRSSDGASIIVEVKTTDTYSIDLGTLAEYRQALITSGKISAEKSSILIVVGRADTDSLEAQVRGSRHAWDIRLISVQALLRLMKIKHDLDDPSVIERIQTVLRPREFTKLDEIVELVFQTAEDVKKEVELSNEDDDDESPPDKKSDEEKKPKFIPVNFRDACAERLSKAWNIPLIKRSFAHFSSADQATGVFCLNSREHTRSGQKSFWFALHPHQVEALRKHADAYLALGCGSVRQILSIPLVELEKWIPKMGSTVREGRAYWHVVVLKKDGFILRLLKPNPPVDLTQFLLPTEP